MSVDPAGLGPRYPRMGQRDGRFGCLRRAAAFMAAFALLFHATAMATSPGDLPGSAPIGTHAQVHAHHLSSGADRGPDNPKDGKGHKPHCCILSVCPGLPLLASDHVLAFLTQREDNPLAYGAVGAQDIPPLPLLSPVGARAPPLAA